MFLKVSQGKYKWPAGSYAVNVLQCQCEAEPSVCFAWLIRIEANREEVSHVGANNNELQQRCNASCLYSFPKQ